LLHLLGSSLDIKDSLKEDVRFFDGGFLAEGKLLEGGFLKGKELLKWNSQRGIAKEELIELVGSLQGNCC
jgi:hypothetical protein